MLNELLVKSADRIMTSTSPALFTITAHFISATEGSEFSFYPFFIDELMINRDYAENFADEIDLHMTISPKDYALMQDQGQDLLCVLTLTYCNRTGRQIFTPPPRQKQYKVLINDPIDIRKKLPDVQHYTEASIPVSVRLVEEVIYNLRHTKINAVYQKMDVKQAIYAMTKAFEIERLHLVDPDNDHVFDHIKVGSYQGISSIYTYLQSMCGVYQKGINAYFTDGVLYVYPAFETNPEYDKAAIFYQVDKGRYSGNSVFHKSEEKLVSIIVNDEPDSVDLTITGAENVGTGFIFNRASRMTDGFTAIDKQNDAQFTENPALTITLEKSRTVTKGRNNLFHVHGTDNPYPHMSTLIAHQASLMTINWMSADPFLLDPCHKLTYYFDKNKNMVKKTGMLESASYRISRLQKMDVKDVFGAVGNLVLRLSPNDQEA